MKKWWYLLLNLQLPTIMACVLLCPETYFQFLLSLCPSLCQHAQYTMFSVIMLVPNPSATKDQQGVLSFYSQLYLAWVCVTEG